MNRLALLVILNIFSLCSFSQIPTNGLDVQHYRFELVLNDNNNNIKGQAYITTKFTKPVQEVAFDLVQKLAGKGMTVLAVKKNDKPVNFTQTEQKLLIQDAATTADENTYSIAYEGVPADGLIISTTRYNNRTFFADNWPNRAHHWIPCNDHPSDKASLEFVITAPAHYQVVANGVQVEETSLPGQLKLTHYKEEVPLPTKVMCIGVADFAVNYVGNTDCIPVYSWIFTEDRDNGFKGYAQAKDILQWYIKKVGAYPYQKLANVQSKTTFGGLENASAIFYFEASVEDHKLEGLIAHEIAHQWFGNSASEKDWRDLWLSEGFVTFMTNVYHEEKYGADSLQHRLAEDRTKIVAFSKRRFTPVSDSTASNNLMLLLNDNSYAKGGWVLHMLRRKIGDSAFWQGLRSYYKTFAGSNATSNDVKNAFEKSSKQDLDVFFKQWIHTPGQPMLDVKWSYEKDKKQVKLVITQQQQFVFSFPLDIKAGKTVKTFNIKDKVTTIALPVTEKPSSIVLDPKVNLLFDASVKESN